MKRVVIIGDLHSGHRAGLTPPAWQFKKPYQNSEHAKYAEVQQTLWSFIIEQAKRLQPVHLLVVNGDCIEGKGLKNGGRELITQDRNEQTDMAAECIKVFKPHNILLTYGCVTAGHRVLTDDLRYVPIQTLKRGDGLFAFTENQHPITRKRYWRRTTVLSNEPTEAEVYRLHISDGTKLEVTYDHPFLLSQVAGYGAYRWLTPKDLYRVGYHRDNHNTRAQKTVGEKTQYMPLRFVRALPVWEEDESREAGYLAGFVDGEGSLSQRRKPSRSGVEESAFAVSMYQNEGEVLERVKAALSSRDFNFGECTYDQKHKNTKCVQIHGGLGEKLRFLGTVRPTRLLGKLNINLLGAIRGNGEHEERLTEIEYVGKKTIYQLQTSTKTYVVEGYLCHNTPYHSGTWEDWEDLVADKVSAPRPKDQLWVNVDRAAFNIRHKTSRSVIPHGRATMILRQQLWETLWADWEERPASRILIRHHVHYHCYAGDPRCLVMTGPALQVYSQYGIRQCEGIVHVGLVWFDIEKNGEYKWGSQIVEGKAFKSAPLQL